MDRDRKYISGYLGIGIGEWLQINMECLWRDENVLKFTVVMIVQLCDYTKYHWVVYLKLVNNVIDEFSIRLFKKIHIFWPAVTLAYLLGAMWEGFNVTPKAPKPGFNSTWTVIFQMFKLDLEKAEEQEIKLPTSVGSSKKWESSRKTSTSALLTMPKPLTVWTTINCRKFLKKWE